jgi:hypothetical protein
MEIEKEEKHDEIELMLQCQGNSLKVEFNILSHKLVQNRKGYYLWFSLLCIYRTFDKIWLRK